MYFVAECIDKSNPNCKGCCKYGVAKQLSIAKIICGYFSFNFPNSAKSNNSKPGLDGDSKNIIRVVGCIAFSQSSIFGVST